MWLNPTRRAFLGGAAKAGAASALKLDSADRAEPEITGPVSRRASFDSGWKFLLGDPASAQQSSFVDRAWRPLDLPHDWSIEGVFDENAPAKGNGAYLPTGIGWYRKTFVLPHGTAAKKVTLEFDGVYQRSEVWINGHSLGFRPYGFISFVYDLTPYLRPTRKKNVIAVRVDNSLQTNCRWYSGSGIYRHTWLRVTDPLHIAQWGVSVQTPSISRTSATVKVATLIANETERPASFELLTEILDTTGAVVQQAVTPGSLAAAARGTVPASLEVASPNLWSPATPTLYRVRSTIRMHGNVIDQDVTTFGMRQIQFNVDRGLLVNGEHIKMNGVCIHGDGGSVGTAVPERIWERRLQLLQEMGCNAIRLSHNPPAPELLDMLDKMGFLVMAEAFDEWKDPKQQTVYGYSHYFDEWSERDLTAMIERDRNHPSIVIWSAGNEVPDQDDPAGPARLQRLKNILHRSDTTRLITVACDQIAAEPKSALPQFLDALDVVGYNYVDRWRNRRELYYSIDRHAHPDRRFVGTEDVTVYGARGLYGTDQRNELFPARASNTEIEVEQLEQFVQNYSFVAGHFIWTGIDYLGEARWPNKLAATGPLDTCGFKKDAFFFYQSIWSKETVLHLSPHWNWAGREGQVIEVTCFTNCDTVELFLNGTSLGVKGYAFPRPGMVGEYGHYPPRAKALQTTADLHLAWDVPYAPGTLTANGVKDGNVVKTIKMQTTGAPAMLELTADRQQIRTDHGDVAHVTVRVLDSEGRMVPTADNQVRFDVQGEGRILGLDNGRPDSHEAYQGSTRAVFNGMALVLLQSQGRPGSMRLSAHSAGLTPAIVEVSAA